MKIQKTFVLAIFLLFASVRALIHAAGTVTGVSVQPRWPWNGLVDITYSIAGDEADAEYTVSFSGYDRDLDRTVAMTAVSGQGVDAAVPAGGPYTATWDAAQDEPEFHSSSFEVTVTAEKKAASATELYLVVDLSGGANAASYPVRYSETGPNLSSDTCRTTELWLRRIPKGTFTMGSPEDEFGRYDRETQHRVTLTQDYYIGVFECTQRQYELVMGTKPSYFSNASYYATRPVEIVSYDDLRGTTSTAGAGWPAYGHKVDATSFFGKLQAKTGLTFDLPTEAQWEYACRAGTATALNSGKNLTTTGQCPNMAEVGRYYYNGGSGYSQTCSTTNGTAKVGSYLPNAWGLYDMHGNVWELCLDWYNSSYYGTAAVSDPAGPSSGSSRVARGGSWYSQRAQYCRSAYRGYCSPSYRSRNYGFRVAFLP